MTKWYNRVGNTIEMCVDGKWIKGIIVKGERSFDGIINMKTLTGQHCWCGIGGEGVHFRKCDDSDGDLITNADKIRTMSDDKLADFVQSVLIVMCVLRNGCSQKYSLRTNVLLPK